MRLRASWSGSSWPTEYKVAGAISCAANAGSPRNRQPKGMEALFGPTPPVCRRARSRQGTGLETPEFVERSERRPTLTAPPRAGVRNLRLGRKKAVGEVEPKK